MNPKQKPVPGFSQTCNTTKLVYFKPFDEIRNAIAREKQLKRWPQDKSLPN